MTWQDPTQVLLRSPKIKVSYPITYVWYYTRLLYVSRWKTVQPHKHFLQPLSETTFTITFNLKLRPSIPIVFYLPKDFRNQHYVVVAAYLWYLYLVSSNDPKRGRLLQEKRFGRKWSKWFKWPGVAYTSILGFKTFSFRGCKKINAAPMALNILYTSTCPFK